MQIHKLKWPHSKTQRKCKITKIENLKIYIYSGKVNSQKWKRCKNELAISIRKSKENENSRTLQICNITKGKKMKIYKYHIYGSIQKHR